MMDCSDRVNTNKTERTWYESLKHGCGPKVAFELRLESGAQHIRKVNAVYEQRPFRNPKK